MKCDGNCFECEFDDCVRETSSVNLEKQRERCKAYYHSHKEYFRQKNKEWWAAHPEKSKEYYENKKKKLQTASQNRANPL